jgi:Flp pilus assembly protein TadG
MRSFGSNQSGAIAVVFGLTFMLLMMTTGGALDFGAAISKRWQLQAAVDAAALASATVDSTETSEVERVGRSIFESNYPDYANAQFKLAVNNNRVQLDVKDVHDTWILKVAGLPTIPFNATAIVPRLTAGKAEVVLVLDYSDSMLHNNKYVRLKEAAGDLIDKLTNDGKNTNVKIGVVPFAALVHADLPGAYVRSDKHYSGCTQDRRAPHNVGEEAGHAGNASKWGEVTSLHSCSGMANAGLKVVPLTSDAATVKKKIEAMVPYLWTHIALGAEMGWQVLSPAGPFSNGESYDNKEVMKVFILMTDGMQTAPGWGSNGLKTTHNAEANLQKICAGMKARNINVFTIGYDLSNQNTLAQLASCASPGNFFDAKDVQSGLASAFQAIGASVRSAMLRLSK